MTDERKRTLRAYGAELVLTDPERRMLAAIEEAERIRDTTGAWMPNQFANPANPRVHYETTGPELWEQLGGRVDAFVYGSGTGGTISGVGRFLKERNPGALVVAVEPARSPVLSGGERGQHQFQGMGPGFVPANFDCAVVDRVVRAWEEDAFPVARRLAREEGLFVGMSSGAIAWAALGVARELGPGKRVAMIAPDSGARYLSTTLFAEDPARSSEPARVVLDAGRPPRTRITTCATETTCRTATPSVGGDDRAGKAAGPTAGRAGATAATPRSASRREPAPASTARSSPAAPTRGRGGRRRGERQRDARQLDERRGAGGYVQHPGLTSELNSGRWCDPAVFDRAFR
jgi:hypothetical protein